MIVADFRINKFDCDTREQTLFIDLEEEGANWKVYGCAIGVHPETDELYMALYHEFGTPTYITRRYSPQGEIIRDYEMIMNYWFPSLPIFPQSQSESGVEVIQIDYNNTTGNLYSLSGVLIKKDVRLNDWPNTQRGIYIWKSYSGLETRKITIR